MTVGEINGVKEIGLVVREQRVRHGMNQRELASKLGISQRYLSEIERGEPKILDDRYINILKFVGLKLRYELVDD